MCCPNDEEKEKEEEEENRTMAQQRGPLVVRESTLALSVLNEWHSGGTLNSLSAASVAQARADPGHATITQRGFAMAC